MRPLLTILLTLTVLLSQAQNWNLVNADRQLHYSIDTTAWYDATVLVDSITTNGADSIFHLNRIVTECDSCPNDWQFHYLRYNQPTFMQRVAVKNGDSWNIRSPNSFAVLPHAQLNDTWLFDTLNNVTAEVTSAISATVLGTTDSIKTISLSNGDSIQLSKNFGVIDMANETNRWHLMGAELPDTVHGFKLPGFEEFFDFQVGDVFQYEYGHDYAGFDNYGGFYEKTVSNIGFTGGTVNIQYDIYLNGTTPFYFEYGTIQPYPTQQIAWSADDSEIFSALNMQLIEIPELYWETQAAIFSPARVLRDSVDLVYKELGSGEWPNQVFYEVLDSTEMILVASEEIISQGIEYFRRFGKGLGEAHYDYFNFETYHEHRLIGYIKEGDTTGIIIDIPRTEFDESQTNLWPNPASDRIHSNYGSETKIHGLEIIGIEGKTDQTNWSSNSSSFEVDVSELKPGLYLLRVVTENGTSVSRFIKQ